MILPPFVITLEHPLRCYKKYVYRKSRLLAFSPEFWGALVARKRAKTFYSSPAKIFFDLAEVLHRFLFLSGVIQCVYLMMARITQPNKIIHVVS